MSAQAIVWMRRDLRLDDHVALHAAARACERVTCAFVLDPPLLRSDRVGAPIVQFFFESLASLRAELRALGSDLALREGDFAHELLTLARETRATHVYYNEDYDPAMRARDAHVTHALAGAGLTVAAFTDHVYAGAHDVLQDGGKPYTVYTPYRRRWNALAESDPRPPVPSREAAQSRLTPAAAIGSVREVPSPHEFGFATSEHFPRGGSAAARRRLDTFLAEPAERYADDRNVPGDEGTSRLSPHLRAGTIGIRTCIEAAQRARAGRRSSTGIDTWIGELTWRDFYQQLLVHAPRIATEPFLASAAEIRYRDDAPAYAAWCEGRTGYPIVDAAMMQLNTTGWMHNRLRMIVASFLTKHLLIDFRRGERYFEQHLADADLAANNGGWQWSASTGTDAAPYFRVFNPTLQGKTYDPEGAFVRSMLPALANVPAKYIHEPWTLPPLLAAELGVVLGRDYPAPIVEHAAARARAIDVYGSVLGRKTAPARTGA